MSDDDTLRRKALPYLREGRIVILVARWDGRAEGPHEVVARVVGNRGTYAVDLVDSVWGCTCRDRKGCAHIRAVQLVTGHAPTSARRVA